MNPNIDALLEEWTRQMNKMRQYIESRNFDMFLIPFRDGSQCFRELSKILKSDESPKLIERHKGKIEDAAKNWIELADCMKSWKLEIKAEAEQVHRNSVVEKKLSGAYSYIKKTGNNLKLWR